MSLNLNFEPFGARFVTVNGSCAILGMATYNEGVGCGEYLYPMIIDDGTVLAYNKEGRAKCPNRGYDLAKAEEKETEWVSVDDRLPEVNAHFSSGGRQKSAPVLVSFPNCYSKVVLAIYDFTEEVWVDFFAHPLSGIKYWMPVPKTIE